MNFDNINSSDDLVNVGNDSSWQNFEALASFIFEKNGFDARTNVVKIFKNKKKNKRRQYDVVAVKNNQIFIADCKKWAKNRHRMSRIKKAAIMHKKRCRLYDKNAVPIIITFVEESARFYGGVAIIPITKLNQYLNEIFKQ